MVNLAWASWWRLVAATSILLGLDLDSIGAAASGQHPNTIRPTPGKLRHHQIYFMSTADTRSIPQNHLFFAHSFNYFSAKKISRFQIYFSLFSLLK